MRFTFLFVVLLISGIVNSQITVKEFQIKITCNVNDQGSIAAIEASSSCGNVEIKSVDLRMSGGCLGNIMRTTTITDECGNSKELQQFINLKDYDGPVFTNAPDNFEVARNEIPVVEDLEVSDNSGMDVKIDFQEKEVKNSLIRTWTATDACGNTSVHQQILKLKKS